MPTVISEKRSGGVIVNLIYSGATEAEARGRLFEAEKRSEETEKRLRKLRGWDPDMESQTYEVLQPLKVVYDEEAGYFVATKIFRP
jgi:hypothetical protein